MKAIVGVFIVLFIIANTQTDNYEPVIDLETQLPQTQQNKPIQPVQNSQVQPTLQTSANTASKESIAQPVRQKRVPIALTWQSLEYYRYQVMLLGLFFIYLAQYWKGKTQNNLIVQTFYKHTSQYFHKNFAHIGFTKQHDKDPFVAQSPHQMMFYASGRSDVDYIQLRFNLRKRQDMIYSYLYEMFFPDKDLITIDIPVKSQVMAIFCLGSKKGLKNLTQNSLDLKKTAGLFPVNQLNQYFHVIGESFESVNHIFDPSIVKKINNLKGLIVSIHYTDQKLFSDQTGHLRAVFNADFNKPQLYPAAFQLLFSIIQRTMSLKLNQHLKSKALEARQNLNATKQKEQIQQHRQKLKKQKQEKLRKEQAWLRSLPPQKQKRQEEKKKKKEASKMMKKTVKVM